MQANITRICYEQESFSEYPANSEKLIGKTVLDLDYLGHFLWEMSMPNLKYSESICANFGGPEKFDRFKALIDRQILENTDKPSGLSQQEEVVDSPTQGFAQYSLSFFSGENLLKKVILSSMCDLKREVIQRMINGITLLSSECRQLAIVFQRARSTHDDMEDSPQEDIFMLEPDDEIFVLDDDEVFVLDE